VTVVPVQARRRVPYDKKVGPLRREVMTWPYGLKCVIPCFLENPRVEPARCPYRKPTQVGEEKILRRLRELWSRNSAIYSRNFGRREARNRVGVYP
jgi:hypothetical protein